MAIFDLFYFEGKSWNPSVFTLLFSVWLDFASSPCPQFPRLLKPPPPPSSLLQTRSVWAGIRGWVTPVDMVTRSPKTIANNVDRFCLSPSK